MERSEDEVEGREHLRLHVGGPVDEDVHLHRAEHAERVACSGQLRVQLVDPNDLTRQPLLAHPVRDREALGMVRDRDEAPAERSSGGHHLPEREGPVAIGRVHLEVGVRRLLPRRIRVEHPPNLRERQEPPSRLIRLGHGGRRIEPSVDRGGDPWSDGGELRERPPRLGERGGLLGPVSSGPGGASEGSAAMIGLVLAGSPQELGQNPVGQGHVGSGSSRRRS